MKSDVTILFCSCDKYKDLWNPFFTIFKNRWKNCPYPIIVNTESEEYSYEGLNVRSLCLYKKNEKISYGKRMLDHLKRIDTPYVMLLLDDFFLREDVKQEKVDKVLRFMNENSNVSSARLTPYQERESYDGCKEVEGLEGYWWMPKCSGYKLNFQVCLWKTQKLIQYWHEDDDPWKWEVFANITTFDDSSFIIVGEDEGPVLDYGYKVNGQPLSDIYRGKWVKENNVERLFEEYNIDYDFSERGFYSPETEQKHFRSLKILPYILKRVGLKNTLILGNFVCINTIKKFLHFSYKELSQYPSAFEK